MKLLLPLLCMVLVGLPVALLAQDPAEDIRQKLAGHWSIDKGSNQGSEVSPQKLEGNFAVITPTVITTFDREKKETYRASYTVDMRTSPVQIDMTATRGGQQVKALGILKFDWLNEDKKKELVIAYSLDPKERPTSFESAAGSSVMVFHMSADPLSVPDEK